MQKVQGQEPALEETRNSKVTIFTFLYFVKDQDSTRLFSAIPLHETNHIMDF
jgi:hypothetical protein